MLKQSLLAVAVTLFASTPGIALSNNDQAVPKAVPILSGKYAYTGNNYCQPVVQGSPTSLVNGGEVDHEVGTVTFDPGTMTFTIAAYDESGDALVLQRSGNVLSENKFSHNGSYSNTATTVTINGTVNKAAYGHVAHGIADFVTLMNINQNGTNGSTCTDLDQLNRQ